MASSGDEGAAAERGLEDGVDDVDPQMEEDDTEDVLDEQQQEDNPADEPEVCYCTVHVRAKMSRTNGISVPWGGRARVCANPPAAIR